jgi:hypothetical protein
MSALDRITGA